ncbi:hypothetical protein CCHR01_05967 [Colletotrichum chrysophilum]|uniref:Uncharacterized protein n=1 Tax=Colletotrichum chrysophilum TaxID=1836956 RepID=A0AAD9APV9_9PEZI|nr:hypothetical protein CCHR01_05967 [Colletotrichum chrysophilum]
MFTGAKTVTCCLNDIGMALSHLNTVCRKWHFQASRLLTYHHSIDHRRYTCIARYQIIQPAPTADLLTLTPRSSKPQRPKKVSSDFIPPRMHAVRHAARPCHIPRSLPDGETAHTSHLASNGFPHVGCPLREEK